MADVRSSPYPVLVALGLAGGELGVLIGLVPLAITGVVLFGTSAAAMARESGLARNLWRALASVAASIGLLALLVLSIRAGSVRPSALRTVATTDALGVRAAVVVGAALFLLVVAIAGGTLESVE